MEIREIIALIVFIVYVIGMSLFILWASNKIDSPKRELIKKIRKRKKICIFPSQTVRLEASNRMKNGICLGGFKED